LEHFSLKEKPFLSEGKTISLWIEIYVRYQIIEYMYEFTYIFLSFFHSTSPCWSISRWKKNYFSLIWNVRAMSTNKLYVSMYIFFLFHSLVPFPLDIYDFMTGEAFLYKVEQYPHRLVQWSAAELWGISRSRFWSKMGLGVGPCFSNCDHKIKEKCNYFYTKR
jgi:hypothetical protein